jgi:hypothetical protein
MMSCVRRFRCRLAVTQPKPLNEGCYPFPVPDTPASLKEWLLEHHSFVVRAGLSLFLAFCSTLLMEGLADSVQTPRWIVWPLSPGYALGSILSMQIHDFGTALEVMGYTSISVDLIYWSAIFFGLFSAFKRLRVRKIKRVSRTV